MKHIYTIAIAMIFIFSASVVAQAAPRDFDTIDNAPEEKERGAAALEADSDTPNGDKVMRILKKRLPGIGGGNNSGDKDPRDRALEADSDTPNGDKVMRILKRKLPDAV